MNFKSAQFIEMLTAILLLLCYVSVAQNLEISNNEQAVKVEYDKIQVTNGPEYKVHQENLTGIKGGKRSQIQKFKYTCAVITGTSHEGAAAILNKQWVLTSAWTILYETPTEVLVRCGSNSAILGGQTVWADKLIIHPQYQRKYANNLGLIKLKKPLAFNKNVGPITMSPNRVPNKLQAVLSGFGYASTSHRQLEGKIGGFHDGWLRTATFNTLSYSSCSKYYKDTTLFTDSCFCTNVTNKLGPCTYDWGDPLVYNNKLVGIYSGQPACFNPDNPAIYADVSQFKPWIDTTIKENSNPEDEL